MPLQHWVGAFSVHASQRLSKFEIRSFIIIVYHCCCFYGMGGEREGEGGNGLSDRSESGEGGKGRTLKGRGNMELEAREEIGPPSRVDLRNKNNNVVHCRLRKIQLHQLDFYVDFRKIPEYIHEWPRTP